MDIIVKLFKDKNIDLEEKLLEFHPFDISQAILEIDDSEKRLFFSLNIELVSEVLANLEPDLFLEYIEDIQPKLVSNIISEMEFDDAVDILQEMDDDDQVVILSLMDSSHREKIKYLMNYKEDTAGAIMTTEYISIPVDCSVKQAMRRVISLAEDAETVNVIYILDKDKLVGVLSLRELIIARADDIINEIMTTNLITTTTTVDQSIVAEIMMDYDFTVLPVVDKLNRLIGIVTIDDVIDVLDEEAVEDISALAGVTDVDIDHDTETVISSVKKRFPWLVVLLGVGFLTSIIIASFEETINEIPILAMFLPLILNMSGNTGTQALAVTVRGLSTNQFVDKKDVFEHLWREFKTSLLNGLMLTVLVFIMAYVMGRFTGNNDVMFPLVISVSVFIALVLATLAGAFIPLVINALKIDPAVASGPFITTINDIISLTIYLTLASIFIVGLS
ncbi:magnesium transporter [Mycoplasmatota bacterium]|nr:magnesium transporter [Mycoplasmatota bacterium]